MAVERKFLKYLVISPTVHPVTGVGNKIVVEIPNTLVKPEDLETVGVSFNGEGLRRYISGDTKQFAKYYYDIVNNNSKYLASPTSPNINTQCSIKFTIYANQNFLTPGYTNTGKSQSVSFNETDIFYISFYYTVVREA